MAIKNFPDISPDAGATFGIQSNNTEFRSALNNNVQHQAMPGDRWAGTMGFSNRTPEQAQKIKAFLTSLGGSRGRFYLTPPDAYQNGTLSGAPVVDGAVAINSETIATKGWDGLQPDLAKAGDYIEVNGELKMITDDVDGSAVSDTYIEYTGTNYMPSPFDPVGYDSNGFSTLVSIAKENPSGSDVIGYQEIIVESGFARFNKSTAIDVASDETVHAIAIIKESAYGPVSIYFRIADINGYIAGTVKEFNGVDGDGYSFINLGCGYYLVSYKYESQTALTGVVAEFIPRAAGGGSAPVGLSLYVQATYFGKADDWPAQVLANAELPIFPPLRKALAGGESITTDKPKGVFYLDSNSQSWDLNPFGVNTFAISYTEDVN